MKKIIVECRKKSYDGELCGRKMQFCKKEKYARKILPNLYVIKCNNHINSYEICGEIISSDLDTYKKDFIEYSATKIQKITLDIPKKYTMPSFICRRTPIHENGNILCAKCIGAHYIDYQQYKLKKQKK